jgi:hypothetical protein
MMGACAATDLAAHAGSRYGTTGVVGGAGRTVG